MNEFLESIDNHLFMLILMGWLLFSGIAWLIRVAKGKEEE